MATVTYPKNGRTRQGFGGCHHVILQHGSGVMKSVKAPSSQDQPANLKGKAWSFGQNKTAKVC